MDPNSALYKADQARRLPIAEAAPIYDHLLTSFPTAANLWAQYAQAQIAAGNTDAAKSVFARCLPKCRHVFLYQTYLFFVQKFNSGQDVVKQAFDFAVESVGDDIASGPIWLDYINLLKATSPGQIVSLRKVYQKAVTTPNNNMDLIWTEYQSFEWAHNKHIAKSLLNDFSAKFHMAKNVYWEKRGVIKDIDLTVLAVPPTGLPKEQAQYRAWKKLLAFEKDNKQRVDVMWRNKRVVLAYEQCLMYLYCYPDIWYDYAMWLVKCGNAEAAVKVFDRALLALPESELLRYAYAELEESRGGDAAAKKIYESLLGCATSNASGLAQIQFLRFLRRTEGIEAANSYFLEAKKSRNCNYNVYVAYADIALCQDKNIKLAKNVFEAGMQLFMHEPEYIVEYLDFLIRLNDEINARALFERALSLLPTEKSVEIWDRYVKFEQNYGNLTCMMKVEQRRKEALCGVGGAGNSSSSESSLQDVVYRYSFRNLCPCTAKDLDHLNRDESLSGSMSRNLGSSSAAQTGAKPAVAPDSSVAASSIEAYLATPQQPKLAAAVVPNPGLQSQAPLDGNVQIKTGLIGGDPKFDDVLNNAPGLVAFLTNMPQQVEGPTPQVDVVLSFLLQSDIPISSARKRKAPVEDAQANLKRDTPVDAFKVRRMQKSHISSGSQSASASNGSSSGSYGEYSVVTGNTF